VSANTGKKLAASAAILAAVGAFVSFGVFSAFSETKSNSSSLTAANFGLTQVPAAGSLLDTITNLIPGDTLTRCVRLTNTGDVPAAVKAVPSITNVSTGTLAAVSTVTLQQVTGIASDATSADIKSCTGAGSPAALFTGVLGGALAQTTLTGTGGGNWAAGETHDYRVIISLPSTVTDLALGGNQATAGLNFVATQAAGAAR
jgi:hypothetical protein